LAPSLVIESGLVLFARQAKAAPGRRTPKKLCRL